jgi:hypothetical protein
MAVRGLSAKTFGTMYPPTAYLKARWRRRNTPAFTSAPTALASRGENDMVSLVDYLAAGELVVMESFAS